MVFYVQAFGAQIFVFGYSSYKSREEERLLAPQAKRKGLQ